MRVDITDVGWQVGDRAILSAVSTVLEPGTFTALVGPNGSGKTTLLHLVAGLRRPSSGTVAYDGTSLDGLRPRERARRVALLEQHPDTSLDVTVRQVVELGRIPHVGRWPGAKDSGADLVDAAMRQVDIAELAGRSWSTLSGGERQRTHLARALAQQPHLLLLDEPTNHLDLRHQIGLLSDVAQLGLTTLTVLHDLDLAAAFCPRVLVLSEGRLVGAGRTEEVLDGRLVAAVFGVRATVSRSDRLRVAWSLPPSRSAAAPPPGPAGRRRHTS